VSRGTEVAGRSAWKLAGSHNAENAIAAILAARHAGIDAATAIEALSRFRGVKRRLEFLGDFGGVRLYDDFAHHPTAINRTLAALRTEQPAGRILVLMEPRSNTMKLGVHRDLLADALSGADAGWVLQPKGLKWDLSATLSAVPAIRLRPDTGSIITEVVSECRSGDTIVIMSNGDFENLRAELPKELARTRGLTGA
jgi:UDP-N-acetylmuramate: L-alanyl-gamma-D-glutamyl-meso-diaminopimelate ligase